VIHYHNFLVTIAEYAELGRSNDFPKLDCCPICHAMNRLQRHGFYERNVIEAENEHRIFICRLRCPDCRQTVSILPDFLLPYFQHTIDFMITILLTWWLSCITLCSRQLLQVYKKRALVKVTEIELFFREEGYRDPLPTDNHEKAIKLFQMIQGLGKSSFTRRWWGHRVTSFMAHSLYHGVQVAKTE
jgi:hypothetical protein